jgi:hypothetical protein
LRALRCRLRQHLLVRQLRLLLLLLRLLPSLVLLLPGLLLLCGLRRLPAAAAAACAAMVPLLPGGSRDGLLRHAKVWVVCLLRSQLSRLLGALHRLFVHRPLQVLLQLAGRHKGGIAQLAALQRLGLQGRGRHHGRIRGLRGLQGLAALLAGPVGAIVVWAAVTALLPRAPLLSALHAALELRCLALHCCGVVLLHGVCRGVCCVVVWPTRMCARVCK